MILCASVASKLLGIVLSFTLLTALSGCSSSDDDGPAWWSSEVSQCSINDDQRASFMAPPHNSQMTIVVDNLIANDPTHGQSWMNGIQRAAQKWNDFGQQIRGSDFFTIQTGDLPDDLRSSRFADCQIQDAGTENHFYMMLETNQQHWVDSGFSNAIPGATVRCYLNKQLTDQVIMVKPDLVRDDQFMSVVLHEMGHSLGLDHSCVAGGATNYANCSDIEPDTQHPYFLAVMFPMLVSDQTFQQTGAPIKEDLQPNDMDRAKCFY
jgi:hypothetical protein